MPTRAFLRLQPRQERALEYIYITAYYPLWAGAATKEQAAALVKNLSKLEQPGGLVMSPYETEGQWDFPYAWAPTQIIALEGLRKYGFNTAPTASPTILSA